MKPHYSQESSGHLCHESLFCGCQELSQQQHWKLLGQEKDFYFVRLTIQFLSTQPANQPVILLCPLPLFLLSILFILPFSLPSRSLSILPSRIPSSLPSPFHLSYILSSLPSLFLAFSTKIKHSKSSKSKFMFHNTLLSHKIVIQLKLSSLRCLLSTGHSSFSITCKDCDCLIF